MYLDDIIMIGRTFQKYTLNPPNMFQQFREVRLMLNPEKMQIFQKEVRYLMHTVSLKGITTDPKKLKAVQEWLSLGITMK